MNELIKRFCNNYYEVSFKIEPRENGYWWGEGIIKRKDTNEVVKGGYVTLDNNKEKIKKDIVDHFETISLSLTDPPADWNSNVAKVLARYLQSMRDVVDILKFTGKSVEQGVNIEGITEVIAKFSRDIIIDTVDIVRKIEELTPQERKEILVSNDDVYNDPDDLWNIDDLTARLEIIDYFLNPSPEEIEQHELHSRRCKKISNRNEALYTQMLKDEKNSDQK
jgi:hypothetical protein